jgi:symplekin
LCSDSRRMEFARLWLNEEWYAGVRTEGDKVGLSVFRMSFANADAPHPPQSRPYDRWLRRLLEHICSFSSNKDKAFSQFMVDLPEVPSDEIVRLGEMCLNPDQCVAFVLFLIGYR